MAAAPGSSTGGQRTAGRLRVGPALAAGDVAQRGAVDVELARVHPFDEAGDRRRVRGRHAVAQHLDGPEGAEVVVALVVEGVVQRRGGVGRPGCAGPSDGSDRESSQSRSARKPISACRAAGTASRSSGSSATVRGNHTARASATWARVQWPRRPSRLCLWSSAAATSDGSTVRPRRRAHATMCSRSRSRTTAYASRSSGPKTSCTGAPCRLPGARRRAGVAGKGDQGGGIAGYA